MMITLPIGDINEYYLSIVKEECDKSREEIKGMLEAQAESDGYTLLEGMEVIEERKEFKTIITFKMKAFPSSLLEKLGLKE